ncbi:MAG: PKD domain-containing protein, partial [Thermoplasmata archaeon]|nr:PKD domain-containing protein [Thermoplasmata archaeon]
DDDITFTGTGTDKGSADTLTYKWEFGDGDTATTANTVHVYDASGNYTVRFTVTDNDGAATTSTSVVWVKSLATATSGGQDALEDAPASAFDKPKDKAFLSGLFDDLLDALAEGDAEKIASRIHVLQVQIGNKVTDSDLKAELLDLLDNLDSST